MRTSRFFLIITGLICLLSTSFVYSYGEILWGPNGTRYVLDREFTFGYTYIDDAPGFFQMALECNNIIPIGGQRTPDCAREMGCQLPGECFGWNGSVTQWRLCVENYVKIQHYCPNCATCSECVAENPDGSCASSITFPCCSYNHPRHVSQGPACGQYNEYQCNPNYTVDGNSKQLIMRSNNRGGQNNNCHNGVSSVDGRKCSSAGGSACWAECNPITHRTAWTGSDNKNRDSSRAYAPYCHQYTCDKVTNGGYKEVVNRDEAISKGPQTTGDHGNRCLRGARCSTPSIIAPNQEARVACEGLKDFFTSGHVLSTATQYRMIVRDASGALVQDSNWKNLSDTLEPGFDEYKTAYEWVYFPEYADGNYDVECRIKYTDDTIEYSSHCALEVAPTGVRCDRLEFDPETIPLSGGGSGSTTAIDYSGVSSTCTTTQIHAGGILARTVCGYTGSDQQITTPAGVSQMQIKAWGAGGGGNTSSTEVAGPGGYASGTLNITGGTSYSVVVGENPITPTCSSSGVAAGHPTSVYGFGGLGSCMGPQPSFYNVGFGGGLSGVFTGSTPVTNTDSSRALLIAGGGGGTTHPPTAIDVSGYPGCAVSSGGLSSMQGGNGNSGGGGGNNGGGVTDAGVGGSCFVSSSLSSTQTLSGTRGTITAPNNTDPAYVAGIGEGGSGNGLVIIEWLGDTSASGGALTKATCDVTNALGGQRNIYTRYQDMMDIFWVTNFFTSSIFDDPAISPADQREYIQANSSMISHFSGKNHFDQNGVYYNYCSAVAAVSTDGYEDATTDPTYVPTYGLVTSAACGSSRATIPIFVGESYCNQITTTNTVYTDVDFEVRCEIDRDGATQPTSYDILVDGGVVRSGTVNSSMTHIVETIRLTSGTHQVACLIKGPDNIDHIDPRCTTEIIPEDQPAGNCQAGDDIAGAALCPGDDTGVGADVPTVIVDQCTDSRKCEYTCGSGFVRAGNRCVPEAFCENLTVPSHIRPERDYPLVQCEGDSNANYFRYTITGPDINYTSPAFPMTAHKGEHVHAGFLPKSGTYEVNCFVGNVAESVHTDVSVPAACQKNIIADTNAPFCKRLDRYIVGESEPNFSDSLLEGENIQYTCTAQPGSPNLGTGNDVFMLRYDAPNAIAPDIGAPMFNIAPLGYPVFQGKTISLQYGHHYSNCLVKVGPGYSTAPECEDDFCASNTGNCTLPRCEPTDHVCCEDELNSEGVCCRLNPSHRSCDTPTTIPPTDMMRRICTNTPSSDVIIGCYDDDCDDYRIDDSSNVSYTTVSNPYLKHGGLIFATVDLNITDTPIPLYIRDGNGVISTRYLYWEGSDRARPNSEGFRYFRVDNGDVITSPEWTNSDVKLSINCQDDMGRGLIDTVFCGCDIPDEHEFEIEYGDKIINQGGVDRTVPNEDNVRFTRILSEREAGRLSIRDTGGNEASGSPYEYDVDWIDTQDPEITISTDHGPIASIDRAAISSTDIQIDIEDEISGIVAHDIKFGNPSVLIEAMNLNCNSGSARYPRTGDRDISIDQSGVQTNRAVFVCAKDAAGNITYKKFTFGGTRLINYYQGPVMGFSYSGELDVSDRQSYEKRLIDRVEDRRVEINDTYHAREGSRIACQNTAIEQNIDAIARGRLTPHSGNLTISDLSTDIHNNRITGTTQKNTDGIIYYSFDTTGGDIDGNRGKVVQISGDPVSYEKWNDPERGPYSPETTQNFRKIGIDGAKTLIIEGGNLYINADMYYEDPSSMLVIVVKRGTPGIHGHGQGGNVYIDKDVTNVNGLIFADGAIVNVENTGSGHLKVLSSYNEEDVEKLRRQLLIYGSLASANTRGGSLRVDNSGRRITYEMKDYDGREGHCPFGTDAYNREGSGFENCSIIDAAKYDLEAFRTFNLGYANEPYRLDAARLPRCGTQDCVCSNSRHERLPVGGIGTATVVPDYFNSTTWALAGKKQCFYGDPKKESKLESFNEFYATYVKFDTRDLKFDFDILSEGRCR